MSLWAVIVGMILYLLLVWMAIGMMRVVANADRQTEIAFEQMMQQRKEEADAAEKQAAI